MACNDRREGFGDVGDRVGIVELTGRHDGCEQGSVLGSNLMAGESVLFLVKQIGRIAF